MFEDVKQVVGDALQLGERTALLEKDTQLLGSIPELDSMAVVVVITALEDHFGFVVDDDEISADTFATVGTLWSFVDQKLNT
jgi:acyl carrier protein